MHAEELRLQSGDLVEVRGAQEILATLDADATLEGLPFMPEMLAFCGRRFRVRGRAHKTCDTIEWSGLRGMSGTVHLGLTRCDGESHGGCQAGCLLFWKERWLRRIDEPPNAPAPAGGDATASPLDAGSESWLIERTRRRDAAERFRCQATELRTATYPLSTFDWSQYVCDVRANGATWRGVMRAVSISSFNRLLRAARRPTFPRTVGSQKKTPQFDLDLQPGELVEVKSHKEILDTLDARGKNRGLTFDPEMVPYCGRRFRVLRRVERIIDEKTGELRSLPGVCLVLDDVICRGQYHRLCPRGTYPYWREIWLRRAP